MAVFTESKFRQAVADGKVNLLATLANERNLAGVVTLPTVGAGSIALANTEADAAAKIAARAADAIQNIALIETVMRERGESTETFVCKSCGKHRPSKTCSLCYEPSEY